MAGYDVVLIHPPAVHDFRRRPIFPGAMGPSVEALQFIKVPIGMLSVAEFLDRRGLIGNGLLTLVDSFQGIEQQAETKYLRRKGTPHVNPVNSGDDFLLCIDQLHGIVDRSTKQAAYRMVGNLFEQAVNIAPSDTRAG